MSLQTKSKLLLYSSSLQGFFGIQDEKELDDRVYTEREANKILEQAFPDYGQQQCDYWMSNNYC